MDEKELPAFSLFKSDRTSTDQDAEAQDPMKAAVDKALKSKEAELEAISKYVQKQVETIAQKTVEKIREMDPMLASELKPRFSPPSWKNVFKISLTDDDQISINKRGSGVRRLILLNFFRAKAEQTASAGNAPGIIYAVEEPETSQHPNNQRMLMDAFANLADEPNRQVILSTHTPMLARTLPADSLRYIEVQSDGTRTIHAGDEETISPIANALGVLADHDVKLFIGIEGRNDINFLRDISKILHAADDTVPDLYALEDKSQVIFFPMGGANLALWASRTRHLNIPEFYIEDSDLTAAGTSSHQQEVDNTNNKPNCAAVLTQKREMENYLHPNAIKAARSEADIQFGDYDDVPLLAAKALHDASNSGNNWEDLTDDKKVKKVSQAKKWLNTEAVEKMTPELLAERDPVGEVKSSFTKIVELMNVHRPIAANRHNQGSF
ncbi:MAG: ATP-binding protein [Deltaproteobacteria bacterium]|nr:ATP-binding protein [Deltaproteobacteria bacterium]